MKKKTAAILMAIVMLCSGVAGATVAWLAAQTSEIVNTFTYGDINLELTETKPELVNGVRTVKMIPGSTIEKDPAVVVKAGSEACWVFVKVEKEHNLDTYLDYSIASGWTELTDETGVYYREQESLAEATADVTYYILTDNQVTVYETITKEQLELIGSSTPKLKFTAYAVQKENIHSVAEAWAKVAPAATTP